MKTIRLIAVLFSLAVLTGCGGTAAPDPVSAGPTPAVAEPSDRPERTDGTEQAEPAASPGAPEEPAEITSVEISVTQGSLHIRAGDAVTLTADGTDASDRVENGTLYVQSAREGDTVLTLPDSVPYDQLTLNVSEGHLYCEAALQLQTLTLDAKHSEVSLDGVAVTDSASLFVEQGSAFLSGSLGAQISAVCEEGALALALSEEESSYCCTLTVSDGDIRLGDAAYHGRSLTQTVGDGDRTMTLTCKRGELSVEFQG